jgi:hypothetical protein
LQQPSPQSLPQSGTQLQVVSPGAQQVPSPQLPSPQSSAQLQLSSVWPQHPSPQVSWQSWGQLQAFSPSPVQQ